MQTRASTQTHIDESGVVSLLEVVQDRGLIQAGELRHVLHLAEFGWVHLLNVILVYLHLRLTETTHLSDELPDNTQMAETYLSKHHFKDQSLMHHIKKGWMVV